MYMTHVTCVTDMGFNESIESPIFEGYVLFNFILSTVWKKVVVSWFCGRLPHQMTYFKRHWTISTQQHKREPTMASTTTRNTQKSNVTIINWVSPIREFSFFLHSNLPTKQERFCGGERIGKVSICLFPNLNLIVKPRVPWTVNVTLLFFHDQRDKKFSLIQMARTLRYWLPWL